VGDRRDGGPGFANNVMHRRVIGCVVYLVVIYAIDLLLLFPARRLEHEIGHIVLARRRGARRRRGLRARAPQRALRG